MEVEKLKQKEESYDAVIVIPTLNEEEGIKFTINSIYRALEQKLKFKIIVVDGFSSDGTVEIAKSMGATVIKQKRKGYGDALQCGFHFVDKHLNSLATVMMDGDGTYEPTDIIEMVDIIKKGEADLVIGNRFAKMEKHSMSHLNKIGNKILSAISRKLIRLDISDTQCGLRAFRSDIASLFYTASLGMTFATEMLAEARTNYIKVKEIPTSYHKRIGKAKLNSIKDGGRILGTIIRIMRDTQPLLFFGLMGFVFTAIGLGFGIFVLIEYFETGSVGRVGSTILSVLLIVLGIQTLSLGLISDLIKNKTSKKRILFTYDKNV